MGCVTKDTGRHHSLLSETTIWYINYIAVVHQLRTADASGQVGI